MTQRWRIDLEYDGSLFAGWQVQPGQRTVQGEVSRALEGFVGHTVKLEGAGRTDSGVHAAQQVAAFTTTAAREPHQVVGALNMALASDVACVAAARVGEDFDPRRDPHVKCYRYTWLDRPARPALEHGRVWHVRHLLDDAAMAEAAACLVGTHDFSSFRAAGCASTHPVRTVSCAEVARDGDHVTLSLHGTGFLRHMVRIVAGNLTDVGRGARPARWLQELLKARDRSAGGRTAPAGGLLLAWIVYAEADEKG